jgi:predicted Ser/Thr protein kinase
MPVVDGLPSVTGYEILSELGRGGMGVVYQARQARLDRLVAIKILPAEVSRDPHFVERFSREARALAKLNHPNIITVHDFGQEGDQYYFVMEFVAGTNLRQRLRAGTIPSAEAFRIVGDVCDALQYAHDEGIVHRDIKPENILLDKRNRIKIADFGIAKLLTHATANYTLTGPWQVVGTWNYMAPEQLDNPLGLDHRADIYSLGVMFYEMLTGKLPQGRFPAPSEVAPVDSRVDDLVLKALEREPQRRFQNVGELRSALDELAGERPGSRPAGKTLAEDHRGTAGPADEESTAPFVETEQPEDAEEIPEAIQRMVKIPSLLLRLFGILNLAFAIVWFLLRLPSPAPLVEAAISFAAAAQGILLTWSSLRMRKFRSYPWAVLSYVVTLLPLSPVWILSVWCSLYGLSVLTKREVKDAFAAQKVKDAAYLREFGPGPIRRWLGDSTTWIIVCCLVGIILCVQPLFPWSELVVLDSVAPFAVNQRFFDNEMGKPPDPRDVKDRGAHVLATTNGYESGFAIFPAVILLAVLLVLIATGFMRPVPMWQPIMAILAGAAVTIPAAAAVLHPPGMPAAKGGMLKEELKGTTKATIRMYGPDVLISLQPDPRFGGMEVRYEIPGQSAWCRYGVPEAHALENVLAPLKPRATAVVYVVAALGLLLLFLGTVQLRGVLMRRRLA